MMRRALLVGLFLSACQSGQPATFATAPELRACEGQPLPAYDGADKVKVVVRLHERTPRSFVPTSLCVRLDDKLLAPEPKTAAIEQLSGTIAFVGTVAPGDHKVTILLKATGRTGSDIEGQRYEAAAEKDVGSGTNVILDAILTAGGPADKRLQFKWDEHERKGDAPAP